MTAPTSVLADLVGDEPGFLTGRWGRRSHLHRHGAAAGLLSLDDVDHLLTATALRLPAFRLVRDGQTLPPSSVARQARVGSRRITDLIDVGKVLTEFDRGATIVLQGVHRYWAPVTDLCHRLEDALTHPVQANAYLTPPVAQGLQIHADAHDVFVVQTYGRKQWVVYDGPGRPLPDRGSAPDLDVELTAGDCLYLPKGTSHAARTVDSPSIHLTLGVRVATWGDVLRDALEEVVAELDGPLPAGFAHDPESLARPAAERLRLLADGLAGVEPSALTARAATSFWHARIPKMRGGLRTRVEPPAIDDETVVRCRPGSDRQVVAGDGKVRLVLGDRDLLLPAAAEPALRRIVEGPRLKVAELADVLDASSRRLLVSRLVREGVLSLGD